MIKKKYKLSEETRMRMSLAHKGKKRKPFSEEHKNNIRLSRIGKHPSKETKKKIGLANAIANKGIIHSEENRRKISETMKRLFAQGKLVPANKNKHHSREERIKQSNNAKINPNYGMKNKHHSKETINKIKEARKKQVLPMRDTLIEIKVQQFLSSLGIEYFTHFWISEIEHKYSCDIFIPIQEGILQKTIIECDGDFIHCNPQFYSEDFIRFFNDKLTAKDIWKKDNIRTKELQDKGYRVIRLWGNEIKEISIDSFKNKIKSEGELE